MQIQVLNSNSMLGASAQTIGETATFTNVDLLCSAQSRRDYHEVIILTELNSYTQAVAPHASDCKLISPFKISAHHHAHITSHKFSLSTLLQKPNTETRP